MACRPLPEGICEAQTAQQHLRQVYPDLATMLDSLGGFHDIKASGCSIPTAVTNVVVGQMLSGAAAAKIRERLAKEAAKDEAGDVWRLSFERMRECGLSRRKAKAISLFAEAYRARPTRFRRWRTLEFADLLTEVRRCWGMADWSAYMLAIFHFGHADVYPSCDGSIARAAGLVSRRLLGGLPLTPELASPYRSYLALYLWRSLDMGFWA